MRGIEAVTPKSNSVLVKTNSPLLLCFSHLRWNFVFQRPQHLLTRAAKRYRVFYFEEPVFEAVEEARLSTEKSKSGVVVVTPVLPRGLDHKQVVAAQSKLLNELLDDEGPVDVCWYYTPMALEFSDHVDADVYIYDCMDELSAFRGAPPSLIANEKKLFAKADLVFTGGMSLYEAKRRHHDAVYPFPSSVDRRHFERARNGRIAEPEQQAHVPHPRIGFFGVIDERMDLELVEKTARLRPDLHFVFIGPVVKIDPASLPQAANIHWLGGKDYQDLPSYIAGWDVAFMPFALNESTRFISPTKTPEFLAAGLPVISTSVADVVSPYGEMGLVEIAGSAEQVSAALDKVMQRPNAAWLKQVDAYLSTMSWDMTWEKMHGLIKAPRSNIDIGRAALAQTVLARPANV